MQCICKWSRERKRAFWERSHCIRWSGLIRRSILKQARWGRLIYDGHAMQPSFHPISPPLNLATYNPSPPVKDIRYPTIRYETISDIQRYQISCISRYQISNNNRCPTISVIQRYQISNDIKYHIYRDIRYPTISHNQTT